MFRSWLLLFGAIIAEVLGTMCLRAAVDQPLFGIGVVIGYLIAFTLLGLALGRGLPIGIAYGTWAAGGVSLVAVLGALLFGETLSLTAIVGIITIVVGVFLVQTGQRDPSKAEVMDS